MAELGRIGEVEKGEAWDTVEEDQERRTGKLRTGQRKATFRSRGVGLWLPAVPWFRQKDEKKVRKKQGGNRSGKVMRTCCRHLSMAVSPTEVFG